MQYYRAQNAALTVVVPWSGEILAMVGSADFNNAAIEGQVNITTSAQQPGSAIKPIVYAAAFEQGWHPGTVVLDAPIRIETPGATDPVTGEDVPFYEPQNYLRTFNGAVTVRTALANSLNIPAVKAVEFAGGAEAIVDMARRMGIKHELSQPPADYGLSIALGSGDVWPLELTNAYATIANIGKYVPVTPILKITDSEDNVLYELDRENTLDAGRAGDPPRDRLPAHLHPDRQREPGHDLHPAEPLRSDAADTGTSDRGQIGHHQRLPRHLDDGLHHRRRHRRLGRQHAQRPPGRDRRHPGRGTDLVATDDRHAHAPGVHGAAARSGRPTDADAVPAARPASSTASSARRPAGCRPTSRSNRGELLDAGGAPALRCDQLTPWQYKDLARTMDHMRKRGGDISGERPADSINRYARAVRFNEPGNFLPTFPHPTPPEAPRARSDDRACRG